MKVQRRGNPTLNKWFMLPFHVSSFGFFFMIAPTFYMTSEASRDTTSLSPHSHHHCLNRSAILSSSHLITANSPLPSKWLPDWTLLSFAATETFFPVCYMTINQRSLWFAIQINPVWRHQPPTLTVHKTFLLDQTWCLANARLELKHVGLDVDLLRTNLFLDKESLNRK